MHIPENYLSPSTCAVMTAAMVPVWVHSVKTVSRELPKEKIALVGVGSAFSFLSMMFNLPLPGGTTGHAVGGTLVALLFGPEAACLAVSIALLLQALLFGDGGIISFGANCFNMAFILPFVGYYFYRLLSKVIKGEKGKNIGIVIGSYVGLNIAALFAAVEFGIQPLLFKDPLGHALYCPYDLSISIPAMMIPHLLVAGVVEAIFTIGVYSYVRKLSPDLMWAGGDDETGLEKNKNNSKKNKKIKNNYFLPVAVLISVLIILTPLGLLSSGTAWGEWGAEEIGETMEAGALLGYTPQGMREGFGLSSIMPDYTVYGLPDSLGYILSAIIGVSFLVIIFKFFSGMKKAKKYS